MRKMNLHKMNLLKMTGALIIAFVFAFALIPSVTASASDGNYHKSGNSFTNPNNGASYQWMTRSDGAKVLFKNGSLDSNEFVSDGTYTYYCQGDGTVIKNQFAWHPTENHPIYFDENGHEVFNNFMTIGDYTYYFQADGSYMADRLTYHPDKEHIIYFDWQGHEVFNAFTKISYDMEGNALEDAYCFFNVYGYMYKNTVTYDVEGVNLYYINENGLLEHNGWFTYGKDVHYGDTDQIYDSGLKAGYANSDGTLVTGREMVNDGGYHYYIKPNGVAQNMYLFYSYYSINGSPLGDPIEEWSMDPDEFIPLRVYLKQQQQ